jgi:hypothetical protein
MPYENRTARAIAGIAALTEMLDCIGREGIEDHEVVKILTENELELRAMREMFLETANL